MTALLISEIFPPQTGGSGRWFWEVYRRLPRADYMIAAGEHPRQSEFDKTHGLSVRRVPLHLPQWGLRSLQGLKGYWRAFRRIAPLIKARRNNAVHCARCLPEGLLGLAIKLRYGIPYLCYAHGEELSCASESRELSWLIRRVLRGCEFVIANSHNTASLLCDQWSIPNDRVHVLHPGVDTTRFRPAPRNSAVRARLGWGDRHVILTVGRLQKRKGHDQMIKALTAIRTQVPDILYAIVGNGEERGALEQLVQKESLADHVHFLGEPTDEILVECYQQCDLFVLPNRQIGQDIEGFGIVLLEAQACGKPVIAGASGGTAETMSTPETGRVVSCDAPDQLAILASELLNDHETTISMGRSAREWVMQRFDWAVLSVCAEQLFHRV